MTLPIRRRLPNTNWRPMLGVEHGALTTVQFVVVHINEGSTAGTFEWWARGAAGEHEADGAQVQVGRAGDVYQLMDLDRKAWHAGGANDRSVGIEHEGFHDKPHPHVQYHASANRVAWICHECELGRPRLNINVFPHAHGGNAWGGHPLCPGSSWDWKTYMALCVGAYMTHWGR